MRPVRARAIFYFYFFYFLVSMDGWMEMKDSSQGFCAGRGWESYADSSVGGGNLDGGGGVGDRYGDRRLLDGMYILIAPTY